MIDLSIVIPHYNSIDTLLKLLPSIVDRENVEVIIVDDNSDCPLDKVIAFVSGWDFTQVKIMNNTKGVKGAGACRNIGLKEASGRWLLFADSDDYFTECFYSKLEPYLESSDDVVFFVPTSLDLATNKISDRHERYENLILSFLKNRNRSNELLLRYKFFVPWSKLISKAFLDKHEICFDEVQVSNDVMFSAKVGYCLERFQVSRECIYCVTKGYGTLTKSISKELYRCRLSVFIRYYKFLKNNISPDDFKRIKLSGLHMILKCFEYKLGVRYAFRVARELKKNKVKILKFDYLNPIFVMDRLFRFMRWHKSDKKHFKNC